MSPAGKSEDVATCGKSGTPPVFGRLPVERLNAETGRHSLWRNQFAGRELGPKASQVPLGWIVSRSDDPCGSTRPKSAKLLPERQTIRSHFVLILATVCVSCSETPPPPCPGCQAGNGFQDQTFSLQVTGDGERLMDDLMATKMLYVPGLEVGRPGLEGGIPPF